MSPDPKNEKITELLSEFSRGVPGAEERLFPLIYDDLHRLATRIHRERPQDTLSPTEIVNEAYLRFANQGYSDWQDRTHFFCVAARIIRRVLVDHARAGQARKRGGDVERRNFSTTVECRAFHSPPHQLDVLALEEALDELSRKSGSRAQVVELRFFAGLSVRETARAMGIHEITVKRHWKFAQAWLLSRMSPMPGDAGAG